MPETEFLSRDQQDAFRLRGVIRLPEFYPASVVAPMAERLWDFLEAHHGMLRDRRESWTIAHPTQFQTLKRSGAFTGLRTPKLLQLADHLLGAGNYVEPAIWGGPLVTLPTELPTPAFPAWHLDIDGAERLDPMATLRVFTFLEPVLPGGGGTLYVAGSHRLAIEMEREKGGPVRSAEVRDRLKAEQPWFARLLATPSADLPPLFGVSGRTGGQVSLEEMTGEPGDLYVMHPAILHGVGHNARDRPRLMLTEWIRSRR